MDKTALLNGFELNAAYTRELVRDVDELDMTAQPNGIINHPAFTIGHLISAMGLSIKLLGQPYEMPEGWDEIFRRTGPGDPQRPTANAALFPNKTALLLEFDKKYNQLVQLIERVDQEKWNETHQWKLASFMPTTGELLYFQCLMHHSWHIGQLAEWRRAMNLDSALAKLVP